jgi:KDO2-lipid IV(A) lauroyltransferase
VADYLVYLLVRVVVCVLQALPFARACQLAEALAWLARLVNRRHRLVALDNLHQAFPGAYTEAEMEALVAAVYRHFCLMLVEIIHLSRLLHVCNWKSVLGYAGPEDGERMMSALLSGRPLMMVTGHFGNWEVSNFVLGLLGLPTAVVVRPLDNPFLDRYLKKFRESTGQKMLAKTGDFEQIEGVLAQGGILGTLGDQDAGPKGPFVEFFGRPASTNKAVALLSLEHSVPLVVIATARVSERPLRFRVYVEEVVWPEEHAREPGAVTAITQRFTAALERIIRRHPEQYFWLHRRWKHQPQARKAKRAA